MTDDLYHDAIMALARDDSAAGRLAEGDDGAGAKVGTATVTNPLCGDRVTIDVALEHGTIATVRHRVRGCALCKASAALIARAAPGGDAESARAAADAAAGVLAHGKTDAPTPAAAWADLGAFAPVAAHKSRHDCVLLPFRALAEALDDAGAPDA